MKIRHFSKKCLLFRKLYGIMTKYFYDLLWEIVPDLRHDKNHMGRDNRVLCVELSDM